MGKQVANPEADTQIKRSDFCPTRQFKYERTVISVTSRFSGAKTFAAALERVATQRLAEQSR